MSKVNGSNGLHAAKQLGLGATVAIAAFYFVFQILMQVGVVNPSGAVAGLTPTTTHKLVTQVDALHAWHNQRDADGILLWYVPRSMTAAIVEQTGVLRTLGAAIRHQTDVLERMDRRDERRQAKR